MKLVVDIPENVYKGATLLGDAIQDAVVQIPIECLTKGIPFDTVIENIKQDIYKMATNSFDPECAECYRIALRCIDGHLKEVNT